MEIMSINTAEIESLQKEIFEKKERLAELRRQNREPVKDYILDTANGPKPLSSFFGDKNELVVVHNMGRDCDYCSLWADGLSGFTKHILTRAGFVLVSADPAAKVEETKAMRGWTFPVAGNGGSGFEKDMGFAGENGSPWPGLSVFTKEGDQIYRNGYSMLGPGDDYCAIWSIWDLFPTGANGWEPK
jgi:predicted dithiol-disulfide oxidoreductase (DUF899 family)